MRVEKRGRGAVYGVQLENNRNVTDHTKDGREFKNSKINWALTDNNINLVYAQNWNQEITKRISNYNARERKNSIVMLDAVYTASPEFFLDKSAQDIKKFFKDCLDFHVAEFCHGDKNLVLNAIIHVDESTPHLHIDFVPFTTGSKRGLETRVSLKQALAAQGFKGGTRENTEWNQWIQAEKEQLSAVMVDYSQ